MVQKVIAQAQKSTTGFQPLKVDSNGYLQVNMKEGVLTTGDLEIGAVELKNATTDDRAKIGSDGTQNALYVQDSPANVLLTAIKSTDGIKKITDAIDISDDYTRQLGATKLTDKDGTNQLVVDSNGKVTIANTAFNTFQYDGTSLADQTVSFANSEAQYTTKVLEFTAPTNKVQDYMISVYNPSTENALRVLVKNMIASFGNITRPTLIDTLYIPAQAARVNPSKVWYYDQSGTSYGDETTDFTDADVDDVAVPGHAEAEIDDAIYIGYGNRFRKVYIQISTPKTDVSTLVWEYYNGATWTALTDLTDGTTGFTAAAGIYEVGFNPPVDWAATAVSGTTAFYIRCRCSAFTSAGTAGGIKQGNLTDNYNPDVYSFPVYGLFNGASKARLVVSNQTAAVAAAATVAGAGAFTPYVRVTPLI